MSTVTMWLEHCASLGSMGNLSRTGYPPQSTWSLAVPYVNPIGPRPPPQWPEGKMPLLEGVNVGDFEVDDSNIWRDGHVAPHN